MALSGDCDAGVLAGDRATLSGDMDSVLAGERVALSGELVWLELRVLCPDFASDCD